jgi:hypothetical protein
MAGESITGRRTLGTTPSHRRRLSNITNFINGGSWSNENELVKSIYNSSDLQLQQVMNAVSYLLYATVVKDIQACFGSSSPAICDNGTRIVCDILAVTCTHSDF